MAAAVVDCAFCGTDLVSNFTVEGCGTVHWGATSERTMTPSHGITKELDTNVQLKGRIASGGSNDKGPAFRPRLGLVIDPAVGLLHPGVQRDAWRPT